MYLYIHIYMSIHDTRTTAFLKDPIRARPRSGGACRPASQGPFPSNDCQAGGWSQILKNPKVVHSIYHGTNEQNALKQIQASSNLQLWGWKLKITKKLVKGKFHLKPRNQTFKELCSMWKFFRGVKFFFFWKLVSQMSQTQGGCEWLVPKEADVFCFLVV